MYIYAYTGLYVVEMQEKKLNYTSLYIYRHIHTHVFPPLPQTERGDEPFFPSPSRASAAAMARPAPRRAALAAVAVFVALHSSRGGNLGVYHNCYVIDICRYYIICRADKKTYLHVYIYNL